MPDTLSSDYRAGSPVIKADERTFGGSLHTVRPRHAAHSPDCNLAMPVKVSLVEDNDRVRESLTSLIDGARGFRCAGAHRSAEAALRLVPEEKPNVVLMDIHLPRLSGVDCVRKLKAIEPDLLVLMLTAYEDDDLIFQALKAGANGYLVKQTPPSEILAAIEEVHEGGAPMSSNIARK